LSGRVDYSLKLLAQARVASLVGCEFCLDVGSGLAQEAQIPVRQLLELARFETSDAFDQRERLALRIATALTATPAIVPPDLRDELTAWLGKAGYLELVVAIAHEHQRTRIYLGLGIRPARFASEDACRIPAAVGGGAVSTVPQRLPLG